MTYSELLAGIGASADEEVAALKAALVESSTVEAGLLARIADLEAQVAALTAQAAQP